VAFLLGRPAEQIDQRERALPQGNRRISGSFSWLVPRSLDLPSPLINYPSHRRLQRALS